MEMNVPSQQDLHRILTPTPEVAANVIATTALIDRYANARGLGAAPFAKLPAALADHLKAFLISNGIPEDLAEHVTHNPSKHAALPTPTPQSSPEQAIRFTAYLCGFTERSDYISTIQPNSPTRVILEALWDLATGENSHTIFPHQAVGLALNQTTPTHVLEALLAGPHSAKCRTAVLRHPNFNPDTLTGDAALDSDAALSLLRNPNSSPTTLAAAATAAAASNDMALLSSAVHSLARHPNATAAAIAPFIHYYRKPNTRLNRSAITDLHAFPNLTPELAEDLWATTANRSRNTDTTTALIANPSAPHTIRVTALKSALAHLDAGNTPRHDRYAIATAVAAFPQIPHPIWFRLLHHNYPEIRHAAATVAPETHFDDVLASGKQGALTNAYAKNPRFRTWIEQHDNPKTRARAITFNLKAAAAGHDTIPPLSHYTDHDDPILRAAAARAVTDPDTLNRLAQDPDPAVKAAAGRRLATCL